MIKRAAYVGYASCKVLITALLLVSTAELHAKIDFGSPTSAINLGMSTGLTVLSPSLQVHHGTIKKSTNASIKGSALNFFYGSLASNESQVLLNATLNNSGPYGIVLAGNSNIFNANAGLVTENILVQNNGNRIEGQPLFTQPNPITLQDAATTLTIALQSALAGNVILNNGTLILEDDLTLGAGAVLTTNGTVNLNGYRLSLAGHAEHWLGSILWQNARDIVLNANLNLSGNWTFTGVNQLNGTGNVIDLSSGGTLWIRSGSTLDLTDVALKGLGTGRIVFEDQSSQLRISNVELQLNRSYTVTTGGIYAVGPTNIITGPNLLVFGQKASMTVDGIGMTYDTLSFLDQFNIRPTASSDLQQRFIAYLNNGVIYRKSDRDMIRFNSNALLFGDRNNSNALLFANRTNSNTNIFLARDNSNTLLFFHRADSSTLLFGNRNNSNALLFGDRNNSATLLFLDRNDSNTKLFLARNLSNALLFANRNNSNTNIFLARDNSNALLFFHRTDSSALLFGDKNNSNALLFGDRNNSATLLFLERNDSSTKLFLARNLSNTLLFFHRSDSNALLFGDKNNSNALLFGDRNNSNALLFGDRNNSNTILFLERNDSNTQLFLARDNSNTLLFFHRNDSSALLFGDRNNSNTLLYFHRVDSNAIKWLDTQLQTIDHGPLDIIINTSYFKMRFDVYLSGDHKMYINNSAQIDGGGHMINLANEQSNILIIANNANVEFTNVVFHNYYDEAIWLGTAASYLFGDSTCLELLEKRQMQRQWTFNGSGIVRGFGNKLVVGPLGVIRGLPHATLTLQEMELDSLSGYNLGLSGGLSTLILRDSAACLSSTYNFTSGNLVIENDFQLTGTSIFNFNNNRSLSILPCSTLLLSGINFIYAPLINNRDLISLSDPTSQLLLDGCTLQSTTTGMRLTNGTLVVSQENTLVNNGAAATSEGFAFGNGSAINDLTIQMNPGASLNLVSGILDYQNVD